MIWYPPLLQARSDASVLVRPRISPTRVALGQGPIQGALAGGPSAVPTLGTTYPVRSRTYGVVVLPSPVNTAAVGPHARVKPTARAGGRLGLAVVGRMVPRRVAVVHRL